MTQLEFTVDKCPDSQWLRVTQKAGERVRTVDVRLEPDESRNGVLRIRQLRIPDVGAPLTPSYLRDLRLPAIEAYINQQARRRHASVGDARDDDDTIATEAWLYVAGAGAELARAKASPTKLARPTDRRLGDEFFQAVAEAYRHAVAHGVRPTKFIAEQADVPSTTATGWVQSARDRGLLEKPGRGRASVA